MAHILKLLGLINGPETSHDGRYLKAYDPEWLDAPIRDENGERLIRTLETTDNIAEAIQFATAGDALECWRKISPNRPVRLDGKPNRPLTAYTCEMVQR